MKTNLEKLIWSVLIYQIKENLKPQEIFYVKWQNILYI